MDRCISVEIRELVDGWRNALASGYGAISPRRLCRLPPAQGGRGKESADCVTPKRHGSLCIYPPQTRRGLKSSPIERHKEVIVDGHKAALCDAFVSSQPPPSFPRACDQSSSCQTTIWVTRVHKLIWMLFYSASFVFNRAMLLASVSEKTHIHKHTNTGAHVNIYMHTYKHVYTHTHCKYTHTHTAHTNKHIHKVLVSF